MTETIAARATAAGVGGVAMIRISGPKTKIIAERILGQVPKPRYATFCRFKDRDGVVIDEGLALYFPNPNSFTGEEVLELHGHGGPVVIDQLLQAVLQAGARVANPGEFSLRSFLNNKIDLTQAEAIADLINASSKQAAQSAVRSLQGEFSKHIHHLVEALIQLRIEIEAAIDFPDEDIDFIAEGDIVEKLQALLKKIEKIKQRAEQGTLLQEGMTVVIAGRPNAGKSSLLNCLTGKDSAIVTDIAGTTRDALREYIHIDGMPLHLIDTAGLHKSDNEVEQEGMRRTWLEIKKANLVLLVVDAKTLGKSDPTAFDPEFFKALPNKMPVLILKNKIDLLNENPALEKAEDHTIISLSIKYNQGIDLLENYLKEFMGYQTMPEGTFIARRRHLNAIDRTHAFIQKSIEQLETHKALELSAEELRQAQHALSEITGEFTSDDLLGRIFSSFCIGK